MTSLSIDIIPDSLKNLNQWVLWKIGERREGDKPTKLPYQLSGELAKANDAATWASFSDVHKRYRLGGYDGIGFEFSNDDPFVGIDLDGCRDPQTGKVAEWAREVILKFDSYAEVSPSGTGVKIFCCGVSPFATGKKRPVPAARMCDKEPAIEVYDQARYFAVTGLRLMGPPSPQERQDALDWMKAKFWPDETKRESSPNDFHSDDAAFERARKYLARLPAAVSGSGGHNATFHAACVVILGFELGEQDGMALLKEYNDRCSPQWSEKELAHKISQAMKQTGKRGYLRNAAPGNWQKISVPKYKEPQPPPEPKSTTLVDAARLYIASIREGKRNLITLGIPDLDQAIGGGVEPGEMIIFAARPSHGKSTVALQCCHVWTELGMPCAIVSEEMSSLMLGKRTVQFFSRVPQEHWFECADRLESELNNYAKLHKSCVIIEGCGTAVAASAAIEKAVVENGAKCAVIDYAQLLKSPGNGRYEQITNTSITLRQLASKLKIVLLVLCQLNRGVEHRNGAFMPVMSDLRDSGQLEQDADVITFLCWPHRLENAQPANRYQFFISKNRNRQINASCVECRFDADRQQITDAPVSDYHSQSDYQSAR